MKHISPLILLFILTFYGCGYRKAPAHLAEKNLEEARALLELDRYEDAFNLYHQTLEALEEGNDTRDVRSKIYEDLGLLYKSEGLYKNALEAFRNRYDLIAENPNPDDIALALRDMALSYLYLKQTDSCYIYLEQAFEYAMQAKDAASINDILNNDMSLYFNQEEEYEQSLCHLRMIGRLNDEIFANKGYVFMKLHEYDSARYNLLKATESKILHIKSSAYCSLAELEGDMENYQQAYAYLSAYQQTLDSIQELLHTDEINSLIYKNINEKQTAGMKMKYQWIFTFLLFLLIIIAVILFFLFQLNNRKKKIARQEHENELLRKEMKILELNELNYRNFKEKPIYNRIMELEGSKGVLNQNGQEMLKTEFGLYFQSFIEELKAACPSLKDDDIYLCCLTKLGLSPNSIALCMGYSDTGSARQRKHRLKKKMAESETAKALFDSIFHTSPDT